MIYFFHHYELPSIVHQARVQHLVLQAQRQSIALPTARRGDGTVPAGQSESSAGQEVNYGAVIAIIPEDSSSQTQSPPDNAAEGVGLSNTGTVQRFGQQRQTWSLFNLPAFRYSNSLILAQVFVRQQPESSQQPSERLMQNAVPVSQRTENDENSNVSNASEVHNQNLAGDVVCNQATAPSCETQQDMELSTDVMNIPWKLEEKMDKDVDTSNKSNPVHVSDRKDGGEGTSIKSVVDTAVGPAGSFYQQSVTEQPGNPDQSATELENNLELLPERRLNTMASGNDNSTSLACTYDTVHAIYTNGNSDHSTNEIQELSRFAISSNSEATCSEDCQPQTEDGNQTY